MALQENVLIFTDIGILKRTVVLTIEMLKTVNDLFPFLLYFDVNLMMALLWFVSGISSL
jgi:hypothetical protein